jgi:hypothetical protein
MNSKIPFVEIVSRLIRVGILGVNQYPIETKIPKAGTYFIFGKAQGAFASVKFIILGLHTI